MADPTLSRFPAGGVLAPEGRRVRSRVSVHSDEAAFVALQALDHTNLPSSDSKPMAEHIGQLDCIVHAFNVVDARYRGRKDVFVASDLLIHYPVLDERSVPRRDRRGRPLLKSVAPDLFVVFGADWNLARGSYVLWQEPKVPDFVLEIASESSREHDRDEKPVIYAEMGVTEYFLFDPHPDGLSPPLRGFRLFDGVYRALPEEALGGNGPPAVRSRTLGLVLHYVDGCRYDENGQPLRELRWHDPETGENLRAYREEQAARRIAEEHAAREAAARRIAEERAAREATARKAAEERIAGLEAQLGRYRVSSAGDE